MTETTVPPHPRVREGDRPLEAEEVIAEGTVWRRRVCPGNPSKKCGAEYLAPVRRSPTGSEYAQSTCNRCIYVAARERKGHKVGPEPRRRWAQIRRPFTPTPPAPVFDEDKLIDKLTDKLIDKLADRLGPAMLDRVDAAMKKRMDTRPDKTPELAVALRGFLRGAVASWERLDAAWTHTGNDLERLRAELKELRGPKPCPTLSPTVSSSTKPLTSGSSAPASASEATVAPA